MLLLHAAEYVSYLITLLSAAYSDRKSRTIKNKQLFILCALRFVFLGCFCFASRQYALHCLVSSIAALLLMLIITGAALPLTKGSVGAGDFKLLCACGFSLGIKLWTDSLAVTFALLAAALIAKHPKGRGARVPLAPFVFCGVLSASVIWIVKALLG